MLSHISFQMNNTDKQKAVILRINPLIQQKCQTNRILIKNEKKNMKQKYSGELFYNASTPKDQPTSTGIFSHKFPKREFNFYINTSIKKQMRLSSFQKYKKEQKQSTKLYHISKNIFLKPTLTQYKINNLNNREQQNTNKSLIQMKYFNSLNIRELIKQIGNLRQQHNSQTQLNTLSYGCRNEDINTPIGKMKMKIEDAHAQNLIFSRKDRDIQFHRINSIYNIKKNAIYLQSQKPKIRSTRIIRRKVSDMRATIFNENQACRPWSPNKQDYFILNDILIYPDTKQQYVHNLK